MINYGIIYTMLELPIPIARTRDDVELAKHATNKTWIPGFLMPPGLVSDLLGSSILDLTRVLERMDQRLMLPYLKSSGLGDVLQNIFGLDFFREGFPIHLVNARAASGHEFNTHTDIGYAGATFHLQGKTPGDLPRGVEYAKVYRNYTGLPMPIRYCVPLGTRTIFRGQIWEGWASYMLAKDIEGGARTLHRYTGDGQFIRFGDHDPEVLAAMNKDLIAGDGAT